MSGLLIAGAVAIGSAAISYTQQKSAAKEQKKAQEAQSRAASVQASRDRTKAIREARIRAAQIQAQAGAAGIGQSTSGLAGSVASIGSQTGANIGAINVQQGFAEKTSDALQAAANAEVKAAGWQAVSKVSNSIFEAQGGWKSVFDKAKKP